MVIDEKKVSSLKIIEIKKKTLKKESLFEEIKTIRPDIIELLNENLDKKNLIFAFKLKKSIKSIYIVETKNKTLELKDGICLDEMTKEANEQVEEIIKKGFKERVSYGVYDRVEWKGTIFEPKEVKVGKKKILLSTVIIVFFSIMGLVLDELLDLDMWYMFIMLGTVLGASYGIIEFKNRK